MTLYLDSLQPLLPDAIRQQLDHALLPEVKAIVDAILRLVVGAQAPANGLLPGWEELQPRASKIVDDLKRGEHTHSNHKRAREDDPTSAISKRPRTDDATVTEDDPRVFSLQSISVSAPIRKKVNVDVHRASIRLTNPSSHQEECPKIPLAALRRAFLLPTRGKSKPHWTVALLPSDVPAVAPKGPGAAGAAATAKDTASAQLVFGLDATLTAVLNTSTPDEQKAHAKGQPSLPALRAFLAHLPVPVIEPTTGVFRSAAGSQEGGGVAGVEAYRGAKEGTLWFLDAGVLWDGKPCEFFALEHLASTPKGEPVADGVRTISATGRTCSVILRRVRGGASPDGQGRKEKAKEAGGSGDQGAEAGDDGADADAEEGVDVDFGMVDGREQEPIGRWIKAHRHLFGRGSDTAPTPSDPRATSFSDAKGKGKAKEAANPREADPRNEDTEDEEDSDFEIDSSDDDASGSDEDSDEDNAASGQGGDGSDEEGNASDASGDETDEDEDETELDPKHHPLLRPGAMPRMSRAAIESVVGMVEQDMAGSSRRAITISAGSEDDEEDELDD